MQSGIVQEDDKTINRYILLLNIKSWFVVLMWTPHSNFDTEIWGTSLYEDTHNAETE